MTPSLNFHTKIMYSLHAMLYMVYGGYDATLEGKISDFEWSVRLIVDGITVMLLWLTAQFVIAKIHIWPWKLQRKSPHHWMQLQQFRLFVQDRAFWYEYVEMVWRSWFPVRLKVSLTTANSPDAAYIIGGINTPNLVKLKDASLFFSKTFWRFVLYLGRLCRSWF